MRWSDLPLDPSRRMLRQFAGLWLVVFSALAGLRWFAQADAAAAITFAAIAWGVGPIGILFPMLLRPIFIAWLVLAFPIGWMVSRVLILAMFSVLIIPVGLWFRFRGRDVLRLRRDPSATSYWAPKPAPTDVASYFRQS